MTQASIRRRLRRLATKTPEVAFEPTADGVKIRLNKTTRSDNGAVVVTALTVDGVDRLADITATSPNLEIGTTYPRAVGNGGILGYVTADTLVPGEWYLVEYEITARSGANYPFFGANSPIANTYNPLRSGIGKHSILVQVEPGYSGTGSIELMRNSSGSMTVAYVRFYKVEWDLDLSAAREWSAQTDPGTKTGVSANTIIAVTAGGTLTPNEYLTLTYEIIEATNVTSFFVPDADSPFDYADLPKTPGVHSVQLRVDTDFAIRTALMKLTGTIKFGFVTLRQAGHGRDIDVEISVGGRKYLGSSHAPLPGVWHVAEDGNDITGTGAPDAPFRQPERATAFCGTNEIIYLRPGVYEPFEHLASGTAEVKSAVTTLDGEEHLATINGDLFKHTLYHGKGSIIEAQAARGAVEVRAKDSVLISNLRLENMPFDGVYIQGDDSTANLALETPLIYGSHIVRNCKIRRVGNSAIWACGYFPNQVREEGLILTDDLLFEYNDVTETNVPTDYNQDAIDQQGVNEAISVAAGVSNAITRFNDIHDTLQYGIDYKHGFYGGAIYGNRIWNVERYAIYIDTNRRTVQDLAVYANLMWNCNNGIVLSREADFDPVADADGSDMLQKFIDIDIYNNVIWGMQASGLFFGRHPGDSPHGEITNVRVRFNTFYNCGRSGSGQEARLVGWSDADYLAAGVVSGFEFIGNLMYRNDGAGTQFVETFSGETGFTVAQNSTVNPSFTDPDVPVSIGIGHLPTIIRPDFTLQSGSAVLGLVTGASASPFNTDFNAASRGDPADTGAFERAA